MAELLKQPYLQKLDDRGDLQVWLVDGAYIRGHIDEEFTNFGQHYRYNYIPLNELWIDRATRSDEQRFFIDHLLMEHHLMAKGWPYSKAHAESSRLEYRCRHHPDELHDALAAEGWA